MGNLLQSLIQKWTRDPNIGRDGQCKPQTLPEKPCQFGYIGVCIRVTAPPAHHDQKGLFPVIIPQLSFGFLNAFLAKSDDFVMKMKMPAITKLDIRIPMFGFMNLAGNIVLRMTSRCQHRR